MQRPTLTDVLIRSTRDGQVIFEAVAQELLPLITKRLTSIERQELIRPGSVFVWEERGPESGTSGVSGRGHWTPTCRLLKSSLFRLGLNVGQMVNYPVHGDVKLTQTLTYIKPNRQAVGAIPGSRRKLSVPVLSKPTHMKYVRNSLYTWKGRRMTTWEGKRNIPIRAFFLREVETHGTLPESHRSTTDQLIKQTYSVWAPTSRETRKWHLGESLWTFLPCRPIQNSHQCPFQWRTSLPGPLDGSGP